MIWIRRGFVLIEELIRFLRRRREVLHIFKLHLSLNSSICGAFKGNSDLYGIRVRERKRDTADFTGLFFRMLIFHITWLNSHLPTKSCSTWKVFCFASKLPSIYFKLNIHIITWYYFNRIPAYVIASRKDNFHTFHPFCFYIHLLFFIFLVCISRKICIIWP